MAKKKKPASRAAIKELLHFLTILTSDVLDKVVRASCVVRADKNPQMCLCDVLAVRDKAQFLANQAHNVAMEIDPEPPFPNPHDRRNYPRVRRTAKSKV